MSPASGHDRERAAREDDELARARAARERRHDHEHQHARAAASCGESVRGRLRVRCASCDALCRSAGAQAAGRQAIGTPRAAMRYAAPGCAWTQGGVSRLIKYLGSKRRLIEHIVERVESCDGVRSVLDLFSGTSRVGHALKARGLPRPRERPQRLRARARHAATWPPTRAAGASRREGWSPNWTRVPRPPRAGSPRPTACARATCSPANGARVDAIRDAHREPRAGARARGHRAHEPDGGRRPRGFHGGPADGVPQGWAPRAHQPLRLRVPALLEGEGSASCLDAREAAARVRGRPRVLDPPYNQHSYLGNYHVWESLVRWDRPEVYGVAMKREDVRTRGERVQPSRPARRRVPRGARPAARALARRVVQRRGIPLARRGARHAGASAARVPRSRS